MANPGKAISLSPITYAQLTKIGNDFGDAVLESVMLKAAETAGVAAESFVSEYPTATGNPLTKYYTRVRKDGTTYQSKFKTLKQQRKVMALVAEGKVPHERTGTLGKSVTSKAEKAGKCKVRVRIGSDKDYASVVIGGDQEQSHYHKGNWTPLIDDMSTNIQPIADQFGGSIAQQLNALIAGQTKSG